MGIPHASIEQYERWAEHCISKFVYSQVERRRLLEDTDFVGGVMTAMMQADANYDPARNSTPKSHRIQWGKYYIGKYFYNKKKQAKNNWEGINLFHAFYDKSIDLIENKEYISSLLEKADLSDVQRKCIELYYFDNKTCKEIGQELNFSRQAAHNNVKSGIEKLREAATV